MSTLLSFDLDLGIQDYAGDTAEQVAEIYNHKDCLDVISEHLKKHPRHSPGARKSSPHSTERRDDSNTAGKTTPIARASCPSPTSAKGNSLDVCNPTDNGLRNVLFAHPEVQLPNNTAS